MPRLSLERREPAGEPKRGLGRASRNGCAGRARGATRGAAGAQVWSEGRTGVEVRVEGFSQKLSLLTQTIFSRLADLHTQARPPGSCLLSVLF